MESQNPVERLRSIVEVAKVSSILTDDLSLEVARQLDERLLRLDEFDAHRNVMVDVVPFYPESRAYLLFTSGSTGKPKGIPISHRSVISFVRWYEDAVALTERDASTIAGSLTFDMHVLEIWPVLSAGG
jgi:non-ribosomal peptide synthetase component F